MRKLDEIFVPYMMMEHAKTLRAAILYHDVEYSPGAWDNEYRSAIVAARECGLQGWQNNEVQRLIMLTKDHLTNDEDSLGKIIIDLDLAGLASDEYESNSKKIRREFYKLSDEEWRAGRVAWLEKFLARPTIYLTDYGKENWETDARFNMVLELNYLKEKINERTDS